MCGEKIIVALGSTNAYMAIETLQLVMDGRQITLILTAVTTFQMCVLFNGKTISQRRGQTGVSGDFTRRPQCDPTIDPYVEPRIGVALT